MHGQGPAAHQHMQGAAAHMHRQGAAAHLHMQGGAAHLRGPLVLAVHRACHTICGALQMPSFDMLLLLLVQVRLYRVRWFFRYLEYDLTVSLLTVTVARNLVIVLYLTHWVACGFNFLARSGGYDPDMLVGLNPELFASITLPEQYVYSLYWSVTTLAGECHSVAVALQA
jgi:hypothetical protein